MAEPTDLIRGGEAARIIGVNPITIWRWSRVGKIPAQRLAGEFVYERAIVEAMAAKRETRRTA